jgi:hypothetical protein
MKRMTFMNKYKGFVEVEINIMNFSLKFVTLEKE